MKGKQILILTSLLVIYLWPFISAARTETIYRVGVEDIDYYPHLAHRYHSTSFAKSVLDKFFNEYGYKFEIIPLPVKRFNDWYFNGEVDFKYPDNPVWRSKETHQVRIIYSEALIFSFAGTIVHRNKLKKKHEIKTLGTLLGFYPQMWQEDIDTGRIELIQESNPLTLVQLPLKGLVDAIDIDYSIVHYNLGKIDQHYQLLMSPEYPVAKVGFHLSTVKHPNVIRNVDLFIRNNQAYFAELKDKLGIIDDPIGLTQYELKQH